MVSPPRHRHRALFLLMAVAHIALMAIAPIAAIPASAVAQDRQFSVLVLHAAGRYGPGALIGDAVLQGAIGDGITGHLDYFSEYLELARLPEPRFQEMLRTFLLSKYGGQRFDLIVVTSEAALDFLKPFRDTLSPGTPVVFATASPPGTLSNATGIITRLNFRNTLDTAIRVQPDTERVFVISGASAFDRRYEAMAREEFKEFEGRLAFTYLSGLPHRELRQKVATLPARSIVFYLAVAEDGNGYKFAPTFMLDSLSAAANAPLYFWADVGLDHGIVGGQMLSVHEFMQRLAELSLRVLRGEHPDTIPVTDLDWTVNQFDWRQLRRWGISESRIPANATILFRQPGAWEQYKWYIAVTSLVVVLQTALIVELLVQRRRRRRVEKQLRESEGRFRLMADTAPVLVWTSGLDKQCDFFNRPWLEFTGRTFEQELGSGWTAGVHPDDLQECLRTYATAFDAREAFRMEYRLRRADGIYRWILDTGVPRFGPDRRFAGYIGSCIDISDRRNAESALRENQQRYALATAAGAVGVWDWNLDANHLYVDPEIKRILGFEAAELPDSVDGWRSRIHPEDQAATWALARACRDGATNVFEREYRVLHKDGSVRWFLSRGSLVTPVPGTARRMVGTSIDVTDRKRTEDQFRFAMEAAPAGMIMIDRAGRIALVNTQVEALFGYRREELIGQPIEMLLPERFRLVHAGDRARFQQAATSRPMGAGRELFGLRKDGTEVPIEIGLNPLRTPEGDFILGSIADITERKAAEGERERLLAQLQQLAGRLIEAQEIERARIARDLHDDVSQQLAALSIGLSSLKRRIAIAHSAVDLDATVASLQQRTIALAENVRLLSHDLHPGALTHAGVVAAVSAHCADLGRQHPVALSFHAEGDFDSIAPGTALCLYRVAQEALRNVIRHAGARHAEIRLVRNGQTAELTVSDDGRGFDVVAARQRRDSLGLVSITERVRLAGGTVSIVTESGKGTRVRIQIPTDHAADTGARDTSAPHATPA